MDVNFGSDANVWTIVLLGLVFKTTSSVSFDPPFEDDLETVWASQQYRQKRQQFVQFEDDFQSGSASYANAA
eukprot:gene171-521_t